MQSEDKIIIRGLRQNNLKNVSLDIPMGKIVVFTGMSGSGKSSIVFDTIAAESQRQMNETYTAFVRGRLPKTLACKVAGYRIDQMCAMEFAELVKVLRTITDPRAASIVEALTASLQRMIDIGLPYLSMDRKSSTLSGGEAQRLKLVRYMGSSLTGMTYTFDEPSTGMHPRDVYRMTRLLQSLRDKGNTVLVVEHDRDVISIADEVIDVGPLAGKTAVRFCFRAVTKRCCSPAPKPARP